MLSIAKNINGHMWRSYVRRVDKRPGRVVSSISVLLMESGYVEELRPRRVDKHPGRVVSVVFPKHQNHLGGILNTTFLREGFPLYYACNKVV